MSAVVRPAVSAKVGATVVRPRELRATLDAGAVLYGTADVVLPLLSVSEVEGIDPRTGMRCTFDLGERDAPPRSFDLGIRSRVVNHKSKEVRLSLATDEALLQDYKPLTDDPGPFDRQSSVRTLCGYVLSKIGATLSSGGAADVPVWVNYVRNPRGVVDTQYWAGDTNSDAPVRLSSGGPDGGQNVDSGDVPGRGKRVGHMVAAVGGVHDDARGVEDLRGDADRFGRISASDHADDLKRHATNGLGRVPLAYPACI